MAPDSRPPRLDARKRPTWLLLIAGAAFSVAGAVGLWGASRLTIAGVPATARVIEHHATSSRSASIVAQVEIAVPNSRVVRTEIYDGLGLGSWEDGGTVKLLCAELRSSYADCEVDSPLGRWLLPIALFVLGVFIMWWWWRNVTKASTRSNSP